MGENADDILNGDVDMFTGEWIGNGQGFPRTMGNSRPKKELEQNRMAYCKSEIEKLGFQIIQQSNTKLVFMFNGHSVQMFPYTGWHTGKGIIDGRGIHNLIKQLK